MLHYQEFGSGPPLIILHGLFGSSDNWRSIARSLADRFTVYCCDLRNHGASFHSDIMSYKVMARDVLGFMDALSINSCTMLGHSMGGKLSCSSHTIILIDYYE